MKNFHISATGHSVNYLPQYIAKRFGYFEEVGLDVTIDVPSPWTKVLTDLDAGRAQAALGGIWVPAMLYQRVKDYRAFCQLSSRCPLVLVSRERVENASWQQLDGKVVLVSGTGGPSAYIFLAGLLHRAGVDPDRIRFIRDLDAEMMLDLFVGGLGDYILVTGPTAWRLASAGKAHIAFDLPSIGGPVPWSVYYARPEVLDRDFDQFSQFSAAIQRASTWLLANSMSDIQDFISELWPAYDPRQLIEGLEAFKASGMWSERTEVDLSAFKIWHDMLVKFGLLDGAVCCDQIVQPPFLQGDEKQEWNDPRGRKRPTRVP